MLPVPKATYPKLQAVAIVGDSNGEGLKGPTCEEWLRRLIILPSHMLLFHEALRGFERNFVHISARLKCRCPSFSTTARCCVQVLSFMQWKRFFLCRTLINAINNLPRVFLLCEENIERQYKIQGSGDQEDEGICSEGSFVDHEHKKDEQFPKLIEDSTFQQVSQRAIGFKSSIA